ncbi:MAG: phage portal protein [Gemmatimonadetes bacterium]|nr:phage portal protein [Gemmatimonadota bacterium]
MFRSLFGIRQTEARDLTFSDIWKRGLDTTDARTAAGEVVDYNSALALSAVFAATRLLSDTISTLPLDVFFRRQGTENVFRPLPEWIISMNPNLRNNEVLGQVMMSLLLDGNAYLATLRDNTGRILEVTPLDPTDITPKLRDEDGRKVLVFHSEKVPGDEFSSRDITHFRGLMKPGEIVGVSPIRAAREMIGLGLGAQKYGAAFFGNGGLPGSMIEVPGQLSEDGVHALKQAWNDVHRGASNSHRLAVLTEGAKFSKVSLNPEDSQFLETKMASVGDVARLYGIPPHLLADASGSTSWGSGLHEQNVAFSMYSLRPYITRLEAGITSMMRSTGVSVAYAKFDLASLNRGTNERWDSYQSGIMNGIYSINEVRALEGLPPIENGDTHYVPLNLAPVGVETVEEL